jgi:hypothetical protein
VNEAERAALVVILRNQVRLADMIANSQGLPAAELQDTANQIGVDAYNAVTALTVNEGEPR